MPSNLVTGYGTNIRSLARVVDIWVRPFAALIAGVSLWVSLLHCGRSWGYCGEWGCATGVSGPGCATVGGISVELWAVAVAAAATAICVFGGVHRV